MNKQEKWYKAYSNVYKIDRKVYKAKKTLT